MAKRTNYPSQLITTAGSSRQPSPRSRPRTISFQPSTVGITEQRTGTIAPPFLELFPMTKTFCSKWSLRLAANFPLRQQRAQLRNRRPASQKSSTPVQLQPQPLPTKRTYRSWLPKPGAQAVEESPGPSRAHLAGSTATVTISARLSPASHSSRFWRFSRST